MYKKGNEYYGRVEVIQNLRGHINADYKKSVAKATGDTAFKPAKRAWGTRVAGTPLVEHNDKFYIEIKCEGKPGKTSYFLDGMPVKDEAIIAKILTFKKKKSDEPVLIRDIPLANLMRLRLNGTTYRVKRG